MKHYPITAFEFDYLSQTQSTSRCHIVEPKTFKYLEKLCFSQSDKNNTVIRLRSLNGERVVQLMHHVGVIQIPNGQQVEILPKIAKNSLNADIEKSEARHALLNMVRTLKDYRHIQSSDAFLNKAKMPLFEVFIEQFLSSVNILLKRGLKSDYIQTEENLLFLKGKLNVSRQLRFNSINKHKFHVSYDDFMSDIPENRLLCSSLNKVSSFVKSNKNQKLCRELLFAFDDVKPSTNHTLDFGKVIKSRGANYYDTPLSWAKLILEGLTPLSMSGNASAISLLFPMHDLFESYVGAVLKKQVSAGYVLKEQARSQYLVKHNNKNLFNLKPDFLVTNKSVPQLLLDTKWKLVNKNKANRSGRYGLSESDFYQMYAYGQKYLQGKGDLVLIYPKSSSFRSPIEYSFDFSEELKLWVVPFDVSVNTDDAERLAPLPLFDNIFS